MSKENITVVKVDTDPAKKSLKDLRKELKELKDEMVNLEEGSDAFLEIANKAGEVKHQIDEINESVKGASADFGDMIGNITNVAAGLTGAFQAVAGGLQAMGLESKAIDETIKRMQGLMAVTQGLGAIDDGIKAFGKLQKAIQSSTGAMKAFKAISNPTVLAALAAGVVAIGAAWNKWGDDIRKNLPWLDEWIKKLDGTTEAELERLKEREDAYNEYNEKIQKAAADIREKRALDLLTPEAVQQIQKYKDDITLLEAKISSLQGLMNENQNNRSVWEQYNQQAITLMENVRQIKHAITDLYNNPIYRKQEETTPVTPTVQRADNIETVGKVIPLQIEPLPPATETLEEMGVKIGKIIADAEIKARNDKWKETVQHIEETGNEIFETIKTTTSAFSESSLGITSGWISSLNTFQTAFQETMKLVKEEGEVSWTSYGMVASQALGGIGQMLNALSQEQDASNEEGFKKTKQLQIAATVMNMLSGIMSAWSSAMSPANAWMTPIGQIAYGTAMSGLIAGVGAAQISKIQAATMTSANPNTNINAKSTSSMIMPPVQYSAAVQGANTEGAIKDSKVYVTETDITNTIKKVSVQENENTY